MRILITLNKHLAFVIVCLFFININAANSHKPWTLLVYMARDNNLFDYGTKNINALKAVNNPNINILVFDCHSINSVKQAQKLLITQNKVTILETIPNLDSGSPDTFSQAGLWAVQDFPSDQLAIVAWDHGSGMLNRTQCISRGFCYDDTTGSYLTDISIRGVLDTLVKARNNQKIAIFGFDACLMADAEIVAALAPYVTYVVASQETIPDDGWNYQQLATWPQGSNLNAHDFATAMVTAYKAYYANSQDYTLFAIDTSKWALLNTTINSLATQLTSILLNASDHKALQRLFANCSNSYFEEPTYMDFAQFCISLSSQVNNLNLTSTNVQQLSSTLAQSIQTVESMVIAQTTSSDLQKATGLSIYFPQQSLEPSYANTYFAQNNAWLPFITQYLGA